MRIEPSIRSNIFTNAHPLGCEAFILHQVAEVKRLEPFVGPRRVLIIGGSSGYGLSSRIALAFGADAHTINVSFESAPKGRRPGSAGWWNNIYFQKHAEETGNLHKDFVGDAFSTEMKETVLDYIKHTFGKIDLVIYSLAAGARKDEASGETVKSWIKTLGEEAHGKTIDVAAMAVRDLTVGIATETEIKDTIFVMGGSDWQAWVELLAEQDVLNQGFKTISYTYIGGPTTDRLYRGGTLGKAKEDLEKAASVLHDMLKTRYQGEALISSSKAVVTKASVFIPQMPVYVSCLFDVMIRHGVHESILAHKHRLYKDMVYGDKRLVDDQKRIRLDHQEMDAVIQHETVELMTTTTHDGFFKLTGTKLFLDEFYKIHGFGFAEIDYDQEVDIEALARLQPE